MNILFHPDEKNSLKDFKFPKEIKRIGIFIGPEGGFSELEVLEAKKNMLNVLNLGRLILRAETASITGISLINFLIN
jgi:16S rRNA (uracil1498-N3)-methyltransferase